MRTLGWVALAAIKIPCYMTGRAIGTGIVVADSAIAPLVWRRCRRG